MARSDGPPAAGVAHVCGALAALGVRLAAAEVLAGARADPRAEPALLRALHDLCLLHSAGWPAAASAADVERAWLAAGSAEDALLFVQAHLHACGYARTPVYLARHRPAADGGAEPRGDEAVGAPPAAPARGGYFSRELLLALGWLIGFAGALRVAASRQAPAVAPSAQPPLWPRDTAGAAHNAARAAAAGAQARAHVAHVRRTSLGLLARASGRPGPPGEAPPTLAQAIVASGHCALSLLGRFELASRHVSRAQLRHARLVDRAQRVARALRLPALARDAAAAGARGGVAAGSSWSLFELWACTLGGAERPSGAAAAAEAAPAGSARAAAVCAASYVAGGAAGAAGVGVGGRARSAAADRPGRSEQGGGSGAEGGGGGSGGGGGGACGAAAGVLGGSPGQANSQRAEREGRSKLELRRVLARLRSSAESRSHERALFGWLRSVLQQAEAEAGEAGGGPRDAGRPRGAGLAELGGLSLSETQRQPPLPPTAEEMAAELSAHIHTAGRALAPYARLPAGPGGGTPRGQAEPAAVRARLAAVHEELAAWPHARLRARTSAAGWPSAEPAIALAAAGAGRAGARVARVQLGGQVVAPCAFALAPAERTPAPPASAGASDPARRDVGADVQAAALEEQALELAQALARERLAWREELRGVLEPLSSQLVCWGF